MTAFETVIGLEVHAQLHTQSKMFCGCGTVFGLPPNSQTCPVCLGLPGSLPVINQTAVEMAVKAGVALNCHIRPLNRFARKNYFYPDLPKGYQISQYDEPICENGWIDIRLAAAVKRIRICRAHLEEDAGKNIHDGESKMSRVDLNRAGTPLLEIVTEPDMGSSEEVVAYLKTLRELLVYLDVCDGNMEQGSLRCEPNVSLRPVGSTTLGTKVELKNINSFKFVKDALEYEIKRQAQVLGEGGRISQETRLWDVDQGKTMVMRSKEEAHDYRYFPDPDLVPVSLSEEHIKAVRGSIQELPSGRYARFIKDYGLPEYDAGVLTGSRQLADYFEACVALWDHPKTISNWVMGELTREMHAHQHSPDSSSIPPEGLVRLLKLVENNTVSLKVAREIFPDLYRTQKDPDVLIQERGLVQISDVAVLEDLIGSVIQQFPDQVQQYRGGKEAVLGFFVGQVMKASKGTANPGKVNTMLKQQLVR